MFCNSCNCPAAGAGMFYYLTTMGPSKPAQRETIDARFCTEISATSRQQSACSRMQFKPAVTAPQPAAPNAIQTEIVLSRVLSVFMVAHL